jgi:hypothetical protein
MTNPGLEASHCGSRGQLALKNLRHFHNPPQGMVFGILYMGIPETSRY